MVAYVEQHVGTWSGYVARQSFQDDAWLAVAEDDRRRTWTTASACQGRWRLAVRPRGRSGTLAALVRIEIIHFVVEQEAGHRTRTPAEQPLSVVVRLATLPSASTTER